MRHLKQYKTFEYSITDLDNDDYVGNPIDTYSPRRGSIGIMKGNKIQFIEFNEAFRIVHEFLIKNENTMDLLKLHMEPKDFPTKNDDVITYSKKIIEIVSSLTSSITKSNINLSYNLYTLDKNEMKILKNCILHSFDISIMESLSKYNIYDEVFNILSKNEYIFSDLIDLDNNLYYFDEYEYNFDTKEIQTKSNVLKLRKMYTDYDEFIADVLEYLTPTKNLLNNIKIYYSGDLPDILKKYYHLFDSDELGLL